MPTFILLTLLLANAIHTAAFGAVSDAMQHTLTLSSDRRRVVLLAEPFGFAAGGRFELRVVDARATSLHVPSTERGGGGVGDELVEDSEGDGVSAHGQAPIVPPLRLGVILVPGESEARALASLAALVQAGAGEADGGPCPLDATGVVVGDLTTAMTASTTRAEARVAEAAATAAVARGGGRGLEATIALAPPGGGLFAAALVLCGGRNPSDAASSLSLRADFRFLNPQVATALAVVWLASSKVSGDEESGVHVDSVVSVSEAQAPVVAGVAAAVAASGFLSWLVLLRARTSTVRNVHLLLAAAGGAAAASFSTDAALSALSASSTAGVSPEILAALRAAAVVLSALCAALTAASAALLGIGWTLYRSSLSFSEIARTALLSAAPAAVALASAALQSAEMPVEAARAWRAGLSRIDVAAASLLALSLGVGLRTLASAAPPPPLPSSQIVAATAPASPIQPIQASTIADGKAIRARALLIRARVLCVAAVAWVGARATLPILAAHAHWRHQWLAPAFSRASLLVFLAFLAVLFAPAPPPSEGGSGRGDVEVDGDAGVSGITSHAEEAVSGLRGGGLTALSTTLRKSTTSNESR